MKGIYFLLVIFTLIGCGASEECGSIKTIHVDVHNVVDDVYTSAFANDVKVIPLETTDDCLIGEIYCMAFKNNHIYISSKRGLYKFDQNGNYVAKIKRNGMGPEEYVNISYFDVDTMDNAYILSNNDRCIYVYDWDGTLVNKIEMGYFAWQMCLGSNNDILTYIGNDIGSSKTKIRKIPYSKIKNDECLNIDPKIAKYLHINSYDPVFVDMDTCVRFCEYFNDTIYSISGDSIRYDYVIDYSGFNVPHGFWSNDFEDIMKFHERFDKENYAFNNCMFVESATQIFHGFSFSNSCYYAIINKGNGKCLVASNMRDDVLLSDYVVYPWFFTKQMLVATIEPMDLMEYADSLGKDTKEHIARLIRYSGEDQNPVLFVANLK